MGIDACIYVKTRDGKEPELCNSLPDGAEIVDCPVGWVVPDEATHEVVQTWRFYIEGYSRGPWPTISATLMALHACQNVETVWYFGDSSSGDKPFTPERVHETNAYYMREGTRPYHR